MSKTPGLEVCTVPSEETHPVNKSTQVSISAKHLGNTALFKQLVLMDHPPFFSIYLNLLPKAEAHLVYHTFTEKSTVFHRKWTVVLILPNSLRCYDLLIRHYVVSFHPLKQFSDHYSTHNSDHSKEYRKSYNHQFPNRPIFS